MNVILLVLEISHSCDGVFLDFSNIVINITDVTEFKGLMWCQI